MKLRSLACLTALAVVSAKSAVAIEWEVWLSDQSNSADITTRNPVGTYGSRILIYDGRDLAVAPPGTYAEDHPLFAPTVVEAAHVFPHALPELGVNVQRLHGMLPHPSHRFMNASFFGPDAGLVGVIDAEGQCRETTDGRRLCYEIRGSRSVAAKLGKALFRTTGPEGSGPSNHMSFWTPDGTKLIVANLGAKLLERIDYDRAADTFTFNKAATLDLVGGRDLSASPAKADSTLPAGRVAGEYSNYQTMHTPSGALKEGPGRPNNVVVCPALSSTNRHAYVTLGGGGLFVVDIAVEPMAIVAEYTNDVIAAAGCGGIEGAGFMHINSGVPASQAGADDSVFVMYRLPLDYPDAENPMLSANEPPVVKFYEEESRDLTDATMLAGRRDAHGMMLSGSHRFLYQLDRVQNVMEVFDLGKVVNDPNAALWEHADAHAGTIDLTGSGVCVGEGEPFVDQDGAGYRDNDDPTPDSADLMPDGRLVVALRSPNPATVLHAAVGSCVGIGLVALGPDGSTGTLTHVFRTFLSDATGTRNLSDIHAAVVRIKGPNVPMVCQSWLGCRTALSNEPGLDAVF